MIEEKLERGLTAQRIWQDLASEQGFTGSYSSVKRFARKLGKAAQLPFRRMERAPGEEAQVDFGRGAPVIVEDGRLRAVHVLRVVLSHSRKAYSEAVFHQHTENFIRVLENAFHALNGIPKVLVIDYVPGNIIDLMWPVRLCGLGPATSGQVGVDQGNGHITMAAFSMMTSFRQGGCHVGAVLCSAGDN